MAAKTFDLAFLVARPHPDGTVAGFQDLYGNLWDPLQPRNPA